MNNIIVSIAARSKRFYLILFILVLTFLVYMPSLENQFTNWDDNYYVLNNSLITNLSFLNIQKIFTEYFMGNYHPLTMLSLSLDYSIGNIDPKSYHCTNLILHLTNTLFVFVFVNMLLKKREAAAIVSVLFGVHTIHVESVAWVSERKDVLYAFFFLFSLIFYLRYLKAGNLKFYWLSLFLFLLSILSKGMAVSLTVSLIAIDFFLGRKLTDRKVIFEKIPFLISSLVFGVVAIFAQRISDLSQGIPDYAFFLRPLFAAYGFVNYFLKLILPVHLSAFYPYPDQHDISFLFWLCLFLAIGITGLMLYALKNRKDIFFGFAFFLINISLVLQLLPVGSAIMADRYSYIPSIGFFIIVAGGYQWLIEKKPALKGILIGILSLYTIVLGALTYNYCKVWKNSITLWNHAIKNYPSDVADNHLKVAYNKQKEDNGIMEIIEDYNKAINVNPNLADSYYGRANAWSHLSKPEKALADYDRALSLNPHHAKALNERGLTKKILKDFVGAMMDFNQSIALDPAFKEAYYNRAGLWIDMNEPEKALGDYNKALSIDASDVKILNNRGLTKKILKDYKGALADFDKAISLDPSYARAYVNRSQVKYDLDDFFGADLDKEKARVLKSGSGKPIKIQ